jgi:hypothetical protein
MDPVNRNDRGALWRVLAVVAFFVVCIACAIWGGGKYY